MTVAIRVNKINKDKVKSTDRKYPETGKRLIDKTCEGLEKEASCFSNSN